MRTHLTLALLCALFAATVRGITVSFPAEKQKLPYVTETYVTGAVDARCAELLYVNGVTTSVHRTGAFIQMVPVKPGANEILLVCGNEKLVRKFTVSEESKAEPKSAPVIDSDDSDLIGVVGAWKTTGELFANRVRSAIDASDGIHYLPKNFVLRGAEVKGTSWIVVWLENKRGFIPKSVVTRLPDDVPVPPSGLIAPNVADGFSELPPYGKSVSSVRICIDPGHGGVDSGAVSPHGWKEKDLNLMQARAIRDVLEKAGFNVVMTRDGDSFPSLLSRPKLAYDIQADAFISVHHNATAPNRDPRLVRHTTTYASTSNGLALATCIQKHVADVMSPVKNAGAQLRSYAVCRNPAVPSCLLEIDFINLPEGEEESWNAQRQHKIAMAVACGILDWMTPNGN